MKRLYQVFDNPVGRAVLLFVVLLAIGLLTRFPAWQFPHLYALHGVLAAPFFSALALWHFEREGSVWQVLVAILGLAALLGVMNVVMGLSFLLLALCLFVTYGIMYKADPRKRTLVCAVAFGALDYPCTLAVGIALGSYSFSAEAVLTILLLAVLAVGLSLFGALLVSKPEC